MAFFASAVGVLQTLVIALGAGLGIWGVINLMEGYGNDNPGAKSQGMKQLMADGWWRCGSDRHHPCSPAYESVRLTIGENRRSLRRPLFSNTKEEVAIV